MKALRMFLAAGFLITGLVSTAAFIQYGHADSLEQIARATFTLVAVDGLILMGLLFSFHLGDRSCSCICKALAVALFAVVLGASQVDIVAAVPAPSSEDPKQEVIYHPPVNMPESEWDEACGTAKPGEMPECVPGVFG